MRFPLYAGLVATLGLAWLATPAQAGPFGLFTKAMFGGGCLHCNCEKPYNAFTPLGYNPAIHQAYPAASAPFGCSPMIGNGVLNSTPVVGGCDSCEGVPAPAAPAAVPRKSHFLHGLFGGSKK